MGVSSVTRNGQVSGETLSLPVGGNGKLYGITAVTAQCPRSKYLLIFRVRF
jgi:hypothetical protein